VFTLTQSLNSPSTYLFRGVGLRERNDRRASQSKEIAPGVYLEEASPEQLRSLAVACFDTRFRLPRWIIGSAAGVIEAKLQEKGVSLLMPPESFVVKGRRGTLRIGGLDRACTWSRMLVKVVEAERGDERLPKAISESRQEHPTRQLPRRSRPDRQHRGLHPRHQRQPQATDLDRVRRVHPREGPPRKSRPQPVNQN
jgi:hypothetical protein